MTDTLPVPLPPASTDDRCMVHDNPNTDDIIKWADKRAESYARACMAPLKERVRELEADCDTITALCKRNRERADALEAALRELNDVVVESLKIGGWTPRALQPSMIHALFVASSLINP